VSRGESLANLQAFKHLFPTEPPTAPDSAAPPAP
jgi:hypothetical protein